MLLEMMNGKVAVAMMLMASIVLGNHTNAQKQIPFKVIVNKALIAAEKQSLLMAKSMKNRREGCLVHLKRIKMCPLIRAGGAAVFSPVFCGTCMKITEAPNF